MHSTLRFTLQARPGGTCRSRFGAIRVKIGSKDGADLQAWTESGELQPRPHGHQPRGRAIPVDEPYLLREMDEPGAILWVRFDLLPRRAILDIAPPPDARSACLRAQVRWMVVAVGTRRPPLLYERPPTLPPGGPPAPWRREGR